MQKDLSVKVKQATKWSAITEIACKLIAPITNAILARLLVPEAFGVVATLTMVVSFAEVFTDAGFQKFIVQHPFSDENDLNISTNVAFWTNLAFSLLMWLGITCFATPIANLVGSPGCEAAIIVISIEIPLIAFSSIQMARYRRNLDFKSLFIARMATALVPVVVTVPLALVFRSYWALVFGTLARDILNAVILTARSNWKPRLQYSIAKLKGMLSFSLWTMAENISTWMTSYLDTLIVGSVLSTYYLGLYKTTMSTANSYLGIITYATMPVLFSALARCQDNDLEYRKIFFRFQRMIALLVFPLGFGLFVYRKLATQILLGDQWLGTADFLGLWSLISAVVIIFSQINGELYRSKGKPKLAVLQQVLQQVVLIPALVWGVGKDYDTLTTVRTLVRLEAVVVSAVITRLLIGIRFADILKNIWPSLTSSVVMTVAGLLLRPLFPGVIWELATVVMCVIVYVACMLLLPAGRKQIAEVPILRKVFHLAYQEDTAA